MSLLLPTLEKTWQFILNQNTPTSGVILTDGQATIYKFKTALISFSSSPWTVVSSSDGSTAGATDKWTAPNKLIWSSGNHSWIILQQTGISGTSTTQMCIDLISTQPGILTFTLSPGGLYTGGTIAAKPTATDEISLASSISYMSNGNQLGTVFHVMMASDGSSTRWMFYQAGLPTQNCFLETVVPDTSSSLSYKGLFTLTIALPSVSWFNGNNFSGRFGSIPYTASLGSEYSNSSFTAQSNTGAISDFTGGYPLVPVSAHSATIGARGRVGRLVDVWLGSQSIPNLATYPLTGGRTFIQIGSLVIPWDGSTIPMVTA